MTTDLPSMIDCDMRADHEFSGEDTNGDAICVFCGAKENAGPSLIERVIEALKPFASISPSSLYPKDGSEAEYYRIVLHDGTRQAHEGRPGTCGITAGSALFCMTASTLQRRTGPQSPLRSNVTPARKRVMNRYYVANTPSTVWPPADGAANVIKTDAASPWSGFRP